jgi:hypothetical protein
LVIYVTKYLDQALLIWLKNFDGKIERFDVDGREIDMGMGLSNTNEFRLYDNQWGWYNIFTGPKYWYSNKV